MKPVVKINAITFRNREGARFEPTTLNIVLGANNSGKSRLLKEIRAKLLGVLDAEATLGSGAISSVVTSDIELKLPGTFDEFRTCFDLDDRVRMNRDGNYSIKDFCSTGLHVESGNTVKIESDYCSMPLSWKADLQRNYELKMYDDFFRFVGPALVDFSGTEERLVLSAGQQYYGPEDPEMNFLSSRYYMQPVLDELSELTHKHFKKYVLFDIASRGGLIQLRVCSSEELYRHKNDVSMQQSLAQECTLLRDEGDGFRSFCMVYLALSSSKPILLIDEPESFLHPPQAYALGRLIGERARDLDGTQVFVATHSARFLEGLLSATDIERYTSLLHLSRDGDNLVVAEGNLESMEELRKDSLFVTSRTFDGLFAKKAFVVEAEADECVYMRLLAKLLPDEDVMIVNVHSKDCVHKAIRFYRSLGVTCGAVVDFDILNDPNKFKLLFEAFGDVISSDLLDVVKRLQRAASTADMSSKSESSVWKHDVSTTFAGQIDEMDELLSRCLSLGLLIVRTGELETVFEPAIPYTNTNKKHWLPEAMTLIERSSPDELRGYQITRDLISFVEHMR